MERPRGASLAGSVWFKAGLALLLLIPPVATRGYDPAASATLVRTVLAHPIVNELPVLVVVAKYALLAVAVALLARPPLRRLGWGYYAVALAVIAVGQNLALTQEYGWVWLPGNTAVQLVVAGFALAEAVRAAPEPTGSGTSASRWWMVVPMALAWLFPYVVVDGQVRPGLPAAALVNEAGLTYCMVTPVILGAFLIGGESTPALRVTAWVGLLFGLLNAMTWFLLAPGSWWMGVLHLPLLVLSLYAMVDVRRRAGGA